MGLPARHPRRAKRCGRQRRYRFSAGGGNGRRRVSVLGRDVFTYLHVGYKLHDLLAGPIPNLFGFEVSEEELRHTMLPREMGLPDGRNVEFQKMKNSHFLPMKGMGG
jgi:hypothetical protein